MKNRIAFYPSFEFDLDSDYFFHTRTEISFFNWNMNFTLDRIGSTSKSNVTAIRTFTCYPDWPKLQETLPQPLGQYANDQPDIITRVFLLRLKELK